MLPPRVWKGNVSLSSFLFFRLALAPTREKDICGGIRGVLARLLFAISCLPTQLGIAANGLSSPGSVRFNSPRRSDARERSPFAPRIGERVASPSDATANRIYEVFRGGYGGIVGAGPRARDTAGPKDPCLAWRNSRRRPTLAGDLTPMPPGFTARCAPLGARACSTVRRCFQWDVRLRITALSVP